MAKKTKSRNTKQTKSAVNYSLLKKLWESGADYTTIAKKLGRHFPERGSDGATKSVRAIVSNCLRNKVKSCVLKPRIANRAVRSGKAIHKVTKKPHNASPNDNAKPKAHKEMKKVKNTTANKTLKVKTAGVNIETASPAQS
jgi:hypothetical protein